VGPGSDVHAHREPVRFALRSGTLFQYLCLSRFVHAVPNFVTRRRIVA